MALTNTKGAVLPQSIRARDREGEDWQASRPSVPLLILAPGVECVHCAVHPRQPFGRTVLSRQRFARNSYHRVHHSQLNKRLVIQELGREGVVPFSSFFASNKPFGAPLPGLFAQYVVSCVFLLLVPPGDAYLFLISRTSHFPPTNPAIHPPFSLSPVSSYCITIINTLVALGLFLLYTEGYRGWAWKPPFRAPKALVLAFFVSNIFLLIVPFIPPVPGSRTYQQLPYWVSAFYHLSRLEFVGDWR